MNNPQGRGLFLVVFCLLALLRLISKFSVLEHLRDFKQPWWVLFFFNKS
jgi:hypothetical protein